VAFAPSIAGCFRLESTRAHDDEIAMTATGPLIDPAIDDGRIPDEMRRRRNPLTSDIRFDNVRRFEKTVFAGAISL
jgi:hypothetical protein